MIIKPTTVYSFASHQHKQDPPMCHFKYNPQEKKMVIECQPIKPYCMIDQLNLDKFCKEEGETVERN